VMGRSLDDLSATSRTNTDTVRVLATSSAMEKSFVDIETGQRGYLITRDPQFLEPRDRGKEDVVRFGETLRARVQTAAARREVEAIVDAVDSYLAEYSDPLVEDARNGAGIEKLAARLSEGKRRADAIRAQFDHFQSVRADRAQREDRAARSSADDARMLARVLWFALAALLVAVALLLARSLSRPLDRMRAGIAQVAEGDFGARVDGGGLPETAELAAAFNDMAAQLQQSRLELDRQRLEVERHAAALERSNADLEQFAYAAAHDLQEPLRTVASYTELLARRYRGQLDAEADEFIEFAVQGATRMQALIRDLLTFSRINTRADEPAPVDIGAVLDDVERSLTVAREESGARIEREGTLPTVLGDRSQMEQLLQNLIGNAIKFRGDAPPIVRIEHDPAKHGLIELRVVDNGIGIKPEYRDRVFRLFQRLNSRSSYDGTGIGLALCKRIVERHGGTIWIESPPDGGTTFHFTLPATSAGGTTSSLRSFPR